MPKILLSLFLFLICSASCSAELIRGDLLEKWQNEQESDSTRIACANLLAKRFSRYANDSCYWLIDEMWKFCHERGNDSCVVNCLTISYVFAEKLQRSVPFSDSLKAIQHRLPLKEGRIVESRLYRVACAHFMQQNQLDSAEHYIQKAKVLLRFPV